MGVGETSVKLDGVKAALSRASAAAAAKSPGFESMEPGAQDELRKWSKKLEATDGRSPRWATEDADVSLMQSFLAREGERLGGTLKKSEQGYEAQFDNLDPRWILSLRDWIKGLRKHDFVVADDTAVPVGNDVRIAIVGDWGTGLYGAPVCAESIDKLDKVDLILHLGDVYYAGDVDEVNDRFLKFWPKRTDAVHRALNGNHEMYTGGKGYFDHILTDARFEQPASYFAFVNDHWLFAGLDTAYAEHELHGDQAPWLNRLMDKYPDRRVMLFSHHQPFSAFEGQGVKLVHKLANVLQSKRVAAWYWGHEHACVRYDIHNPWQMRGRCIGHGGFPYFRFVNNPQNDTWVDFAASRNVPGGSVLDGPNDFVPDTPVDYGPNGFLTLAITGNTVNEDYRDPKGAVIGDHKFTA
jgi:predicted phosphodiesterase